MGTHFEQTLENDLERIREKISRMASLGQQALRNALRALQERNRQLAYAVILGDRKIDETERDLDRLCLAFLVRQQPVAGPLRFAYSTIRINLELERIGDYAESIARQVLKIIPLNAEIPFERFAEIANLAIPMLHQAVKAFVSEDAALASRTMRIEEEVDLLRNSINADIFAWRQNDKIPLEALTPLMTIARRFERVSDQAKNICEETIYCATGEYTRHKQEEIFRVLFVCEHDACRAPMAAAIGNALGRSEFVCESAGLAPDSVDPRTISFLAEKGITLRQPQPRSLKDVSDLDRFHAIIGLAPDMQKALPPTSPKTVFLDWSVPNPAEARGTDKEIRAAYEHVYREIQEHTKDLAEAILVEKTI